jgi:hypothetical protein
MQLAHASVCLPLHQKHFMSRFPVVCNVHRWNENVAMDIFFCNTPNHDDDGPSLVMLLVVLWPNSVSARQALRLLPPCALSLTACPAL